MNSRAMACKMLLKVVHEGKSFHPQLIVAAYPQLDERDCAFISHLCFGVLRFYNRLQGSLNGLLRRPLKPKDKDLTLLMMVGLYQLFYTDIPPFAIVHATVEASGQLSKPWARGLINGVLRQALRNGNEIKMTDPLTMRTSHPQWLVKALQQAWPQDWEHILEANLQHPPFVLRVNLSKISRENYLQSLLENEIEATPLAFCPAGILVLRGCAVESLPHFSDGFVSVQDGAAQLAGPLLNTEPSQHVLDACAAPGGKTTHLLEIEKSLNLLALDKDPQRLLRVNEALQRLNLCAKTLCADAAAPQSWWKHQTFDRILLDAPCSATGVIRRHPDIKLHRQLTDITLLAQQQKNLLDKLWPLLKPNGILLYATCSILPQENVDQIAQFLQTHSDAQELPIMENWGRAQKYGRQVLPGQHDMDGFYYARLYKIG